MSRAGELRIALLLAAALAGASGCNNASPDGDGNAPPEDPILTNLTDPEAVLDSFAAALNGKDFDAYAALLDAEFACYPLEVDVADFPWLPGDSWDLDEELASIANLFDPAYNGPEAPVDRVSVTLSIVTTRSLGEGLVEFVTTLNGTVLRSATDGWAFDTRLVFELIRRGPFWRIRSIREMQLTRTSDRSVEITTWCSVRALYR